MLGRYFTYFGGPGYSLLTTCKVGAYIGEGSGDRSWVQGVRLKVKRSGIRVYRFGV